MTFEPIQPVKIRLRHLADILEDTHSATAQLLREAADDIERLTSALVAAIGDKVNP
jgi:hypothetical protein